MGSVTRLYRLDIQREIRDIEDRLKYLYKEIESDNWDSQTIREMHEEASYLEDEKNFLKTELEVNADYWDRYRDINRG